MPCWMPLCRTKKKKKKNKRLVTTMTEPNPHYRMQGPIKIHHSKLKPADQPMSRELDQVASAYRSRLRSLSALWGSTSAWRLTDTPRIALIIDRILAALEQNVGDLMDKELKVEKARQSVLNLGLVLDVSRQTVESKSQHLGQEERQKEEEQNVRFREFQKIHKLQADKATIEKDLVPSQQKLHHVMAALGEKNEKMRNLEKFHESLSSQCADDMVTLKGQTDIARAHVGKWEEAAGDVGRELKAMGIDKGRLTQLETTVCELKQDLHNHRSWHEEEMHTKLFLSTRSKEIKHRLTYFRTLLHRLNAGHREDGGSEADLREGGSLADNFLVDGSPGVQAREVEQYLSRQLGTRVLADYTMLKRLKDEIGVQGLAYLVEKIRLQGTDKPPTDVTCGHSCWEEKKLQEALYNIALEYRDQDENKRLLCVPALSLTSSADSVDAEEGGVSGVSGVMSQRSSHTPIETMGSASNVSHSSRETGVTERSTTSSMSTSSRRSSANSLRRKGSISRIKKLLKF